jgi:cobalt-precorrin-5B (C1)-methyltransferase
MSEQAYKDSLALSIKQAVELGYENLSLVFGNYGQQKANELGFKEEQIIRMSNFVGFMLDKCVKAEIKQVTLIGQIGKLVKVTAGIFNTHSQVADARLETIAAYTASLGANTQVINQILKANTAEEAVQIVYKAGYREVFLLLAERAAERVKNYIDDKLQVETVFFSLEEGILAATNSINAGDRDE